MPNNSGFQKRHFDAKDYSNYNFKERILPAYRMMPHSLGLKLLDIGCSDGQISRFFMDKGYDVKGIDISDKALAIARSKGVSVDKVNIEKRLPYRDGSFDIIFCGETFEHLLSPSDLVKECYRILKPGGCLVATFPNISTLRNALLILAGSLPCYSCIYDGPHIRDFCMKEIGRLFQESKFKNIEFKGVKMTLPFGHGKIVSFPPIITRFSDYLIAKGSKNKAE